MHNHTQADTQTTAKNHLCKHCNSPILNSNALHDHCAKDYEWEIKMKSMNRSWKSCNDAPADLT